MQQSIEIVTKPQTIEVIREGASMEVITGGQTVEVQNNVTGVIETVERGGKGAKGDTGEDGASADLEAITDVVDDVVGDEDLNFELLFENQLSQGA